MDLGYGDLGDGLLLEERAHLVLVRVRVRVGVGVKVGGWG